MIIHIRINSEDCSDKKDIHVYTSNNNETDNEKKGLDKKDSQNHQHRFIDFFSRINLKDQKCEKKHDCPSRTKCISYFPYALFTGGSLNYYHG